MRLILPIQQCNIDDRMRLSVHGFGLGDNLSANVLLIDTLKWNRIDTDAYIGFNNFILTEAQFVLIAGIVLNEMVGCRNSSDQLMPFLQECVPQDYKT